MIPFVHEPSACLQCEACAAGCPAAAGSLSPEQAQAMGAAPLRLGLPLGRPPRQCWHCARAACIEVCPAGAMRLDAAGGSIWVDRTRCVGCWMCVLACPFGAVVPAADGRYAAKCDGCRGLDAPACAGVCFPRDSWLGPIAPTEAARQRRADFAAAGWGWPLVEAYPPPRSSPYSPVQDQAGVAAEASASWRYAPHPRLLSHERERAKGRTTARYVLVGAGIAAVQAVEAIRAADQQGGITMVADETDPPYSRVLLSHYLAGRCEERALALRPADWLEEMQVELVAGDGARRLDADRRCVVLQSGREVVYDRLLIATGARPIPLPTPGADLPGVAFLRNLGDAAAIRSWPMEEAVVIGGGFVGLKAAEALQQRGARVAVVEKLGHLLPQMLDAQAAQMVREQLEAHGIRILAGTGVAAIEGRGRVSGVVLESGERLRCDLVVVGVGVRPNVDWLQGTPVCVGRGVVVDERMETSLPDVWAAGDVAETRDLLSGRAVVSAIWPAAAVQGRLAGANMAGAAEVYEGSLAMNTLEVFGLAVASFGDLSGECVVAASTDPPRYRAEFYRGGTLVGAILVGDIAEAGCLLARVRGAAPVGTLQRSDVPTANAKRQGRTACV